MNITRVVRYIIKIHEVELLSGLCGVAGPTVTNDEICMQIIKANVTSGNISLDNLLDVSVELYFIKDTLEEAELKAALDDVLRGSSGSSLSIGGSFPVHTGAKNAPCNVPGGFGGTVPFTDEEFLKSCGIEN